MKNELTEIVQELRYYSPSADRGKGAYIHKGWADRIEKIIAAQAAELAALRQAGQEPAEIQRYEPERYDEARVRMEPCGDGDYITYADHLAVVAALKPDAERYRRIRSQPKGSEPGLIDLVLWGELNGQSIRGDKADAVIDAAIAAELGKAQP